MNLLTIYTSSRRNGNSEQLAKHVTATINTAELFLSDFSFQPIKDQRHSRQTFDPIHDGYRDVLETFLQYDTYLFAIPVYWFSMPAQLKIFIDRWSQYMRDPQLRLKDQLTGKKVYLVVTANDEPLEQITAPLVQQFDLICNFIGLELVEVIIGKGNKPGEVLEDHTALQKAAELNKKLLNRAEALRK
ncbi:flavodoxin family protein [Alkalicoccobacillus murimartini]|uniref:Multimeric flavodoxin WrbA n=1 Tax=Alkalicoccobacillus murimartini TaxID=171685 RepID=A0ABT9YID1_9BACI|nr:flavodoxin family protein [Alkalicoccobacillus murimartini]MDQ0207620.1 multimeric flavodoxin WrbA [Alkalicoccobacillus murimartini]